jgi:hypothetical protein
MKHGQGLPKRVAIGNILLELAINSYLLSVILLSTRVFIGKGGLGIDSLIWFFLGAALILVVYAFYVAFKGKDLTLPKRLGHIGIFIAVLTLPFAWIIGIRDLISGKEAAPSWAIVCIYIGFFLICIILLWELLWFARFAASYLGKKRPKSEPIRPAQSIIEHKAPSGAPCEVHTFNCSQCGKQHREQAFISHASKDERLARHIAIACCQADAAPFLFEYESDPLAAVIPADQIADEIVRSRVHFVLLGPRVSEAYWTQAWIGYEIGITRGYDRATKMQAGCGEYFSTKIIVVEDIRQGIEACVPYLHALLLFDFHSDTRWKEFEDAVRFLADTAPNTPEHPFLEFYKAGNRLRGKLLKESGFRHKCGSSYDVWAFKEDVEKLPAARLVNDNGEVICAIKCPSCSKHRITVFRPAL